MVVGFTSLMLVLTSALLTMIGKDRLCNDGEGRRLDGESCNNVGVIGRNVRVKRKNIGDVPKNVGDFLTIVGVSCSISGTLFGGVLQRLLNRFRARVYCDFVLFAFTTFTNLSVMICLSVCYVLGFRANFQVMSFLYFSQTIRNC